MKFFLLTVIFAAAFGAPPFEAKLAQFYDPEIQFLLSNPIDDLWRQALEFVRALLKKYEPFQVPDMPEQTVTGDGINLKAKFDKVLISNADDFTIDNLENNVFGLWAKFQVTIPKMHIEGDYTVVGTVKEKSVNGKGHFKIDLDQMTTGGYVKIGFKGTYLQMDQLDIYYTVKDLQFSENGLTVEGMTEQEIEELFHNSFLQYFQDNEEFVCKQISTYVMEQANKIMYNKSLQGLLDWLKDFIDGKIVPTPAYLK